jgi:hypothetical protein
MSRIKWFWRKIMANFLIDDLENSASDQMIELSREKQEMLNGGATIAGTIAFGAATAWAAGVAGFAAGSIVPGVGNFAGAAVGAGVGFLAGVGFTLATSE